MKYLLVRALIIILGLATMSDLAYILQIRNVDTESSFKIHVDANPITLDARGMGTLEHGLGIEILSGPYKGIKGKYVGTAQPNLRIFIKDGLPVITTDAEVDAPLLNMQYTDADKAKAQQLSTAEQTKQKQQNATPQISPMQESMPPKPAQTTPAQAKGSQNQQGQQQADSDTDDSDDDSDSDSDDDQASSKKKKHKGNK